MNDAPDLSLVIPMHNESDCIDELFASLSAALGDLNVDYEIVCVNDGSTDDTLERLRKKQRDRSHVRVVDLSRNFGKEAAVTAGLMLSKGLCVVPIDADLQDPPELIGRMLEKWREGSEVVNAARSSRSTDTIAKRTTARVFYSLLNKISDIPIPKDVGDFRLLDRKVVDVVCALPERTRFNKGLFAWVGFRQTTLYYERPKRDQGKTSFNYWRLWNFAIEGFTSFSSLPLRIWSYLGALIAALSIVAAFYNIAKTLIFGVDVPGYASLIVTMLFLNGLSLFGIGVLGEYVSRVFIESKQRPLYVVREIYEPIADPSNKVDC